MKKFILLFILSITFGCLQAQQIPSPGEIKEKLASGSEWRIYKERVEQQNADKSFIAKETYYHDNFIGAIMFDGTVFNYLWIDDENAEEDECEWNITDDYHLRIFNSKFGSKDYSLELINFDNTSIKFVN